MRLRAAQKEMLTMSPERCFAIVSDATRMVQ